MRRGSRLRELKAIEENLEDADSSINDAMTFLESARTRMEEMTGPTTRAHIQALCVLSVLEGLAGLSAGMLDFVGTDIVAELNEEGRPPNT